MNKGKVIQVIGSVFDAKFAPEQVPAVYNAIEVQGNFGKSGKGLYGEVQQHLGGGKVRAISLSSTLGLRRGLDVIDTGSPLMVPVGPQTLGRVFNLFGEPIDEKALFRPVSKCRFTASRPNLSTCRQNQRCLKQV